MVQSGQPIRVGVIGTGFGRKAHLPAFYTHPEFKPVAVLASHRVNAEKMAAEYDLDWHGTNLSQFMIEPVMDLVAIASMPSEHYRQAKWAVEAGKHLLLEKPPADNHKQVRELDNAFRSAGLVAAINFEFRNVPARMMALKLIKQGAIGKQRHVELRDIHNFWADPSSGRPHGWQNQVEFGGGIVGMMLSHHIDWFTRFGWKWGQFASKTATFVKERVDENGVMKPCTADDFVMLESWREDGATACITCSACFHYNEFSIRMYGTHGTIEIIGDKTKKQGQETLFFIKPDGERQEVPIDTEFRIEPTLPDYRADLMMPLLDRLAKAIRGEPQKELPSMLDAYNVQYIIDVIRQQNAPSKL